MIFWLAHKERQGGEPGQAQARRPPDRRPARSSISAVTARDAKGEPITGLEVRGPGRRCEGDPKAKTPSRSTSSTRATRPRGSYFATAQPGEYQVTVVATRDGKEIGRDSRPVPRLPGRPRAGEPRRRPRPAPQIAETTGGEFLAPEQLAKYLRSLDRQALHRDLSQTEHKVWDNWPFLLIFATLLTLEWWLRKRHGWV